MSNSAQPGRGSYLRIAIAFTPLLALAAVSLFAAYNPRIFIFVRGIPLGDKAGHFLLFGLVAFIVLAVIPKRRRVKRFAVALLLCYIVLDEALQLLTPNRSFELWDLFAGLSGMAVFSIASLAWRGGQ